MLNPYGTIIVILFIALNLNGCILERIFRVKNQLCDFEKNFQIETSEGFRILLRAPVMLDEDITWLAGAEPSKQEIIGDELVMTYIAERNREPSNEWYDLPIELRFVRLDGKYRLKEGYLGKNLTEMLTEEMLTQIMLSVCKSQKSLVKQQIIIDINTLDRTLLPAKSKIIHILGPPNPKKGDEHHLTYDYQLKNNDAVGRVAVIDVQFDRTAERILRIKMKYFRYNLDADFEKGEAILNVDIFDDREA